MNRGLQQQGCFECSIKKSSDDLNLNPSIHPKPSTLNSHRLKWQEWSCIGTSGKNVDESEHILDVMEGCKNCL